MLKLCNKKGFTMIELLAAIVILGVISILAIAGVTRLIEKSKNESEEDYATMLKIAAQSYMEANKGALPKRTGNQTFVTAQDLKAKRYLKEEKGGCVEVRKRTNTTYEYIVNLKGNCSTSDDDANTAPKPNILEFMFVDEELNEITNASRGNLENVAIFAKFNGGKDPTTGENLKLESYSYIISIKLDGETEFHEEYNSGVLSAAGEYEITINRKIKEFIDVTEKTHVRVDLTITNQKGGTISKPITDSVEDPDNPQCDSSSVIGAASDENDWINKKDPRQGRVIRIDCNDGNGSGCVAKSFTRTWPNDYQHNTEWGYIQVKDNAGNKSVTDSIANTTDICNADANPSDRCRVRVNVDKVNPSIKVIGAYKANATGGIADTTNHFNSPNKEWNDSTGNGSIENTEYNNISDNADWFNSTKYPNGVVFEVLISDNIHLDTWSWATNNTYIIDENSDAYTTYSTGNDRYASVSTKENSSHSWKGNCGPKDKIILIGFKGEGKRKGKLTVKDKAKNEITLEIEANIDRTAPPVPNNIDYSGGYNDGTWSRANVVSKARDSYKVDAESGPNEDNKVTLSGWNYFQHNVKKDYDGNYNLEKIGQEVTFNKSYEGKNQIRYKSCDRALNCSEYGKFGKVWVDFTYPECKVWRERNDKVYTSNSWLGKGSQVTVLAECQEGEETTKKSGCYATGSYQTKYSYTYNSDINTSIASAKGFSNGEPISAAIIDKAGNVTPCASNQTVKIDTKPPVCNFTGQSTTWAKSRTINKGCTDNSVKSPYTNKQVASTCTSESNTSVTYQQNNATVKTVAYTNYGIADQAGNAVTCTKDNANKGSATVNIYVDRQPPSCTYSKSNTTHTDGTHNNGQGNPDGITVSYKCDDLGVKGQVCPKTANNVKKTQNTWVADKLGNGMTCTAPIYTKTEKRYRKKDAAATCTSSCCGYKTCRTSACGCQTYNSKCNIGNCGGYYRYKHFTASSLKSCGGGYAIYDYSKYSYKQKYDCEWHANYEYCKYKTVTTYSIHCRKMFCKTCRHERHGCQTYYSCSASACGAKKCTSVKCCGYKCGSSHWHAWGGSSNGCSHQSRTLYY